MSVVLLRRAQFLWSELIIKSQEITNRFILLLCKQKNTLESNSLKNREAPYHSHLSHQPNAQHSCLAYMSWKSHALRDDMYT